ncbi:hypothetical protein JNK13_09125 [bacterium]|nr:hypothetical protein [bacterium]
MTTTSNNYALLRGISLFDVSLAVCSKVLDIIGIGGFPNKQAGQQLLGNLIEVAHRNLTIPAEALATTWNQSQGNSTMTVGNPGQPLIRLQSKECGCIIRIQCDVNGALTFGIDLIDPKSENSALFAKLCEMFGLELERADLSESKGAEAEFDGNLRDCQRIMVVVKD